MCLYAGGKQLTQMFSLFKSITGSYGEVWVEVLVRGYFNIRPGGGEGRRMCLVVKYLHLCPRVFGGSFTKTLLVWVVFNPFTSKSDQLQFSLSVTHQRYIIQYGELDS